MDRRKFLEKFVKASGVSLAAGVCVSCTAPGNPCEDRYNQDIDPTAKYIRSFNRIEYLNLNGKFSILKFYVKEKTKEEQEKAKEEYIQNSDNILSGIPISTKLFHLVFNYEIKQDALDIKKYINVFYFNKNERQNISFNVKNIFSKDLSIELVNNLNYHITYYIEVDPKLFDSTDIRGFYDSTIYFFTTSLQLSTEKIEMTEGDTKIVNVKKAFYKKDKVFTSFDKVSILSPSNEISKDKDSAKSNIVKITVDGNDIVIEAVKKGDVILEVLAHVQDGEQVIEFYTELYVKVN